MADAQADLPWARTSLRIASGRLDRANFETVVRRLVTVTGSVTVSTSGDADIWIDQCPLPSGATAEAQLAWAVGEAESVAADASGGLVHCSVEVWLGLAVGAQLGVVCESASLSRLGALSVDLVLDLYGWD